MCTYRAILIKEQKINHEDEKVTEAREKAIELLESSNYNVQLVALQAILNYDIQLRILESSGPGALQPTHWPALQKMV